MRLSDWPCYSQDEIELVSDVLKSGRVNYWTGTQGKLFEREFADYCGVRFGVAVANGSLGLDLAIRSLDIGPGDEVVVTPRSFFASVGAIVLAGATPVFADVDPDSQNISADSIRPVLTKKTKAIMCVHLAGWPCDMPAIMELAGRENLRVIEDCAQAHGAMIDSKPVGSWGDIAVFSFCQDKILTTGGEGGMVVTNSEQLRERVWSYKDHGKSFVVAQSKPASVGFRWVHESVGTNCRLTEMAAAIGRWQLQRLDDWVQSRRRNATILESAFADIDCVRLTRPDSRTYHSYYKYYVFVRPEKLKKSWDRNRILTEFNGNGIPGLSGSCPEIYREEAFRNLPSKPHDRLPTARMLGETSVMFPVHPTLERDQMEYLASVAARIFQEAQASV